MKFEPRIPTMVRLYDEGTEGVHIPALRSFIRDAFGVRKICHFALENRVVALNGLELDMIATLDALDTVRGRIREGSCDIILTPRLFASPGNDNRLHIRASVYSDPSIISTSGIVEGPAKPREYYLCKQQYARLGAWERESHRIAEQFRDRFIDYGDARLTGVIKGYVAQALFFFMTGSPFCARKKCRLFNAHWQEDLIRAQIGFGVFCSAHKRMLARIARKTHRLTARA
jgi:hypothetical protein